MNRKLSERGTALILFTIMTVLVVLPMIGLSIDGGVSYLARERLLSATDAAALAGARSLNVGLTVSAQTANVQSIATQYFYANFPQGYLNSSNVTVSVPPPVQSTYHTVTVAVQSTAIVNLYFLGLIGHPTATLTASAQTSRRDVNVVLTLDRSGSMGQVCQIMKSDAENFVSKFVNGRDTVGLITFMGNANVNYPSTKNFDSQNPTLNNTLAQLNCGGNTGSAAAITLAHQQILNVAEPGALNVIVFFTDGVPNGYQANFPLKSGMCLDTQGKGPTATPQGLIADGGGLWDPYPMQTNPQQYPPPSQPISSTYVTGLFNCPWGAWNQLAQSYSYVPGTDVFGNSATASAYAQVARDSNNNIIFSEANSDAISQNAADDAARQARKDGIVIYTIGLDGDGGVDNTLLERFANDPSSPIYNSSQPTGKYYYSPNAGQLGAAFNSIASQILRISQ